MRARIVRDYRTQYADPITMSVGERVVPGSLTLDGQPVALDANGHAVVIAPATRYCPVAAKPSEKLFSVAQGFAREAG
mgnify:CR=1 FL=1